MHNKTGHLKDALFYYVFIIVGIAWMEIMYVFKNSGARHTKAKMRLSLHLRGGGDEVDGRVEYTVKEKHHGIKKS